MGKKEYPVFFTDNDRILCRFKVEKGKLVGFVVEYEAKIDGKWMTIRRYDTAHGFAHMDTYVYSKSKGRKQKLERKIQLGNKDTYNNIADKAIKELKRNYRKIKQNFVVSEF